LAEAEEGLRRAHAELEQRVQQRTAELDETNRRLQEEMEERHRAEQQARRHQEELARVARLSTVGEMVAELAHELNQPLAAISNYAQACARLLAAPDQERTGEVLSSMHRVSEQADRAAEIVRRLRRFVRQSRPGQSVQAVVDINTLIHEVVALLDGEISAAQVETCFELTDPLPHVAVDRIQVEQVLVNLIRNALDAMHECDAASRQLAVQTSRDANDRIRVCVQDSGTGIPPDQLAQVFHRFFTTKPEGMGLGLPISRSIVENHGGKLSVTSVLGRGTTFQFDLPVHRAESRGRQ
jgi:C4-dicarboxylate-specific signal transduction histidine kinase